MALRGDGFRLGLYLGGLALGGIALVAVTQTSAWPAVYVALAAPVALGLVLRSRRDAASVTGIFILLLLFIPSRFAFAIFSAALTPALLVGLVCLWLWICLLIVPHIGLESGPQPLRFAILLFLWAAAISWALAFLRPFPDIEQRQALIGYLSLASAGGVALLVADGVTSRARLDTVLDWLVLGAAGVAMIAIVQFATGYDVTRYLRFPGLDSAGTGELIFDVRSSLRRAQGTTEHPIELAVFLTSVIPVALHYARHYAGSSAAIRRARWLAVGLLLASVPLTVSRAGVVGLTVGAMALMALWPGRMRANMLVALAALTAVLRVAVPGLVGTLLSLFTESGTDPSITHRTNDYVAATPFILDAPWFGRGFHTFIHSYYFVIDNQYLSGLIEIGFIGVAAMVGVFLTGIVLALLARRITANATDRDLAHALAASILVAAVGFFSFDALSFPMATNVTFLVVGCAAALWAVLRRQAAAQALGASTGMDRP